MTITQLTYFLKLTESMNFSQAASQLYISQSSLSQHIIKLERELGVTLFERRYGGLSLTPEGERLKEIGGKITGDIGSIKSYVKDAVPGKEENVIAPRKFVLGMDERAFYSNFDLTSALVSSLRAVGEKYGGTEIMRRQLERLDKMLSSVYEYKVDVCLGAVKPEKMEGLVYRRISSQQVNLVVRRQPQWQGVMPSSAELVHFLNSASIFTVQFEPGYVDRINEWLQRYGVGKKVELVKNGWFLQLELQLKNIAAFIPTHALQNEFGNQDVFVLPIQELAIPRYMVWRKDNSSPVLKDFLEDFTARLQDSEWILQEKSLSWKAG